SEIAFGTSPRFPIGVGAAHVYLALRLTRLKSSNRFRRVITRYRIAPREYRSLSNVRLSFLKTSGAEKRISSSDPTGPALTFGSVNFKHVPFTKTLEGFIAPWT